MGKEEEEESVLPGCRRVAMGKRGEKVNAQTKDVCVGAAVALAVVITVALYGRQPFVSARESGHLWSSAVGISEESLVEYVDVLRGVAPASGEMSRGNVLPIMALPRGMAHWTVQTRPGFKENWFVNPASPSFYGIRCTHQPSPWIGDYGQFNINLFLDGLGNTGPKVSLETAKYGPHRFSAPVLNYCSNQGCTKVDFAPSRHGGLLRLSFPPGLGSQRRRTTSFLLESGQVDVINATHVRGYSTHNSGGIVNSSSFKHHFVADLSYSPGVQRNFSVSNGTLSWTLDLDNALGDSQWDVVEIRIGVSFIGASQAQVNLGRVPANFEAAVSVAEEAWNRVLGRIQVWNYRDTPSSAQKTFYTNLYRTLLFPRDLSEKDANNLTVHWSPYDSQGRVFPGPLCTDSGFWDAYRAVYPLLHLVFPDLARTVMSGWMNAIRENGGIVPQWGSPGPRNSMVGSMSDVTLAEAIAKGQISAKDQNLAYDALLASAFNASGGRGAEDLRQYIQLGYVPDRVALTLNYKLADRAIERTARIIGDDATAEILAKRAAAWRVLYDNETQFFRPKDMAGRFRQPFDPLEWTQPTYTEGGPWQYRFYVPFDPVGLRDAYQGSLCDKLKEAMVAVPAVHLKDTFHEALELGANCFGQYAHNNQPSHHILYIFAHAGANCPQQGQLWIQHVLGTLYGPFGFSGDEDNGEMASWYLLSALGLYALDPASGDYQVGAPPLFENTQIELPGKRFLRIERNRFMQKHSLGDKKYFVSQSVVFNGEFLGNPSKEPVVISFQKLMQGGTLLFQ